MQKFVNIFFMHCLQGHGKSLDKLSITAPLKHSKLIRNFAAYLKVDYITLYAIANCYIIHCFLQRIR